MTTLRAARRAGVLALLALTTAACSILSFDFGGASLPVTVSTADAGEAARLITAYRRSRGLGPVVVDARLNEPAAEQARAIAKAGDLSHGDFAGRMAAHDVSAAAENLAMGSPTVSGAMTQWKESPPHNANLLKEGHTRIGFARAETKGRGGNRYWALVLAR